MSDFQLSTPVAFIIFNRPDTTERVFAEIAKAKPPKLLVVADGHRLGREEEVEKCELTRSIIDRVDWDCEVLTNYSEVNLGCKVRVSSGLDWVFEQVEEAIILEDDCLPHSTFFRFCEEMLKHYRNDMRVGMISGDNFLFGHRLNDDSYFFSNFNAIWGWATWRSRWQSDYDVLLNNWPKFRNDERIYDWFHSETEQVFFNEVFEDIHQGRIDTWDFQWFFASRFNGRLSIMPNENLITNIGFGEDATHTTKKSKLANLALQGLSFPLKHPDGIFASISLDGRMFKLVTKHSLLKRLKMYFYKNKFFASLF